MRGDIRKLFFLFSTKTFVLGYSLEVPQWGTSNEYPKHMFYVEIRKISTIFGWKKCLIWKYMYFIFTGDNIIFFRRHKFLNSSKWMILRFLLLVKSYFTSAKGSHGYLFKCQLHFFLRLFTFRGRSSGITKGIALCVCVCVCVVCVCVCGVCVWCVCVW